MWPDRDHNCLRMRERPKALRLSFPLVIRHWQSLSLDKGADTSFARNHSMGRFAI